ncbi:hypothetical protein V1477_005560 [Vespula maculifrons]|uniref:Uncharacterized protein n=1 Tax=Vespula maculifrons TaxID=7453 RepID=A0ABD2CR71_VESMC
MKEEEEEEEEEGDGDTDIMYRVRAIRLLKTVPVVGTRVTNRLVATEGCDKGGKLALITSPFDAKAIRSSTSLYPWDITGDPKIPMGNGKRKESPIGERDGAARNTVSRNIPPYGDPMAHPLGRSLSPPPPPPSPSLPTTSGNVSSNIASTY